MQAENVARVVATDRLQGMGGKDHFRTVQRRSVKRQICRGSLAARSWTHISAPHKDRDSAEGRDLANIFEGLIVERVEAEDTTAVDMLAAHTSAWG